MDKMNEFEQIEMAYKLNQWDDLSNTHSPVHWGKIIHEGNCSHHCYGRGFFYLRIYVMIHRKWNEDTSKYDENGNYSVRVWYGTIDDGDFGGWYEDLPLEDAKWIANEIKDIYNTIYSLPTDDEMNKLLEPTGMKLSRE